VSRGPKKRRDEYETIRRTDAAGKGTESSLKVARFNPNCDSIPRLCSLCSLCNAIPGPRRRPRWPRRCPRVGASVRRGLHAAVAHAPPLILSQFSSLATSTAPQTRAIDSSVSSPLQPSESTATAQAEPDFQDADFANDLASGMEALLKSLGEQAGPSDGPIDEVYLPSPCTRV
jgi:hypothetical protein